MRRTEGRAHDSRGRVWSDAAPSQGVSRKARSYRNPGRSEEGSFPRAFGGSAAQPTP